MKHLHCGGIEICSSKSLNVEGEFNMQETDEANRFLKNAEYFYNVCKDEYEKDKSVRYGMKQSNKGLAIKKGSRTNRISESK